MDAGSEALMEVKQRYFIAGAATTAAIVAVAFGGGALLATASGPGKPATRVERQASAPAARVVLAATSEPAVPAISPAPVSDAKSAGATSPPAPPLAQIPEQQQAEERPLTRRELRQERHRLRDERRAERWARRHHLDVPSVSDDSTEPLWSDLRPLDTDSQ
jgi:hypothetical protein